MEVERKQGRRSDSPSERMRTFRGDKRARMGDESKRQFSGLCLVDNHRLRE